MQHDPNLKGYILWNFILWHKKSKKLSENFFNLTDIWTEVLFLVFLFKYETKSYGFCADYIILTTIGPLPAHKEKARK